MRRFALAATFLIGILVSTIVACNGGDETTPAKSPTPTKSVTPTTITTPTLTPTTTVVTPPATTATTPDLPTPTNTPTTEPTLTPEEIPDNTIIDHNIFSSLFSSGKLDLSIIPEYWIKKAKSDLHIAYEHTSHGTQLVSGMVPLDKFMGGNELYTFSMDQKYEFEEGGFFWDEAMEGYGSGTLDLSHEDTWYPATVAFLEDPGNYDVDVVMWSWCNILWHSIPDYISNMEALIAEYGEGGTADRADEHPVTFIFMTGHVNGDGGESGPTYEQNQPIRDHCATNNRWLYDFADIEKYDLDGNYFGDRNPDDTCDYNGGNWAIEYQNSHIEGVDWYECESAHSQPVNANQKAFAAWWMLARLAGWDGEIIE